MCRYAHVYRSFASNQTNFPRFYVFKQKHVLMGMSAIFCTWFISILTPFQQKKKVLQSAKKYSYIESIWNEIF